MARKGADIVASYVEEQYIQALEKENAELKKQLENRREKIGFGIDSLNKFNHCRDVKMRKENEDMNQRKEKEPCGSTAQNSCRPIEDAVMDLMVSYGIALINLSDVLTKIIKNVTEDSNYYLNNQIWSSKDISMFERIYGIKPFSPGSFDCTGMVVCDKDGKIIPHKKIIIGHLGKQEITIDVLDRKDR